MEQSLIKYPIGIHNFKSLRTEGYAYVDKTDLVWQLANQYLERREAKYDCILFNNRPPEERFIHVIEAAYEKTGMPVVMLPNFRR